MGLPDNSMLCSWNIYPRSVNNYFLGCRLTMCVIDKWSINSSKVFAINTDRPPVSFVCGQYNDGIDIFNSKTTVNAVKGSVISPVATDGLVISSTRPLVSTVPTKYALYWTSLYRNTTFIMNNIRKQNYQLKKAPDCPGVTSVITLNLYQPNPSFVIKMEHLQYKSKQISRLVTKKINCVALKWNLMCMPHLTLESKYDRRHLAHHRENHIW